MATHNEFSEHILRSVSPSMGDFSAAKRLAAKRMKAMLLLRLGLLSGLAVFTGCAWLKPPVNEGRGAVGPTERQRWENSFPWVGQESAGPSRDYKGWRDDVLREFRQTSPGASHRGR